MSGRKRTKPQAADAIVAGASPEDSVEAVIALDELACALRCLQGEPQSMSFSAKPKSGTVRPALPFDEPGELLVVVKNSIPCIFAKNTAERASMFSGLFAEANMFALAFHDAGLAPAGLAISSMVERCHAALCKSPALLAPGGLPTATHAPVRDDWRSTVPALAIDCDDAMARTSARRSFSENLSTLLLLADKHGAVSRRGTSIVHSMILESSLPAAAIPAAKKKGGGLV